MIPVILLLFTSVLEGLCHIFTKRCAGGQWWPTVSWAPCSYLQLSHSTGQTVNYAAADRASDDFPFLFISKTCILRKQTALWVQHSFSCLCRKWEPCQWSQWEQRWIQRQTWMRLVPHFHGPQFLAVLSSLLSPFSTLTCPYFSS